MEKLYEQDPFLTRFSATVEACSQGKKGYDVLLDQTAFYPEGGGQPYDLGTLGGVNVIEVHEREGRVVLATEDLPRSFVLCQRWGDEPVIYLCQPSSATLKSRMESKGFE